MRIEAGTGLGRSTRQVTMPDNPGTGKHLMKDGQQVRQPFGLSRGTDVARQSVLVQPTLVADAYRAMVVRHGMSSDLKQHAVLRHRTLTTDMEVISNLAEITRTKIKRSIFFE